MQFRCTVVIRWKNKNKFLSHQYSYHVCFNFCCQVLFSCIVGLFFEMSRRYVKYCDMSTSCWVCSAGVAQRSVARQPSAKQLATKHTLRGGEGRRGLLRAAAMTPRNSVGIRLLRAAAMTSHGSTLASEGL
jgi:hypothetical protein